MTIKQFAYLAGFIIVGIIFYSSPLPFFFSYPLSFISIVLGIGIAFVPVQGRSLEQWIIAFIKSIYSPTQYIWRQSSPESTAKTTQPAPTTTNVPLTATTMTQAPMPITQSTSSLPQQDAAIPSSQPESTKPTISETLVDYTKDTSAAAIQTSTKPIETPQISSEPPIIPKSETIPETSVSKIDIDPLPTPATSTSTTVSTPAPTVNLPIPFTPNTPNTLVGLTLTPDGKILDNVLVEIQSKGLTIRATKSNRLGQFMFARPLERGLYQILAEKEGYQFATYSLDLTDQIVKPLKIQAEK